MLTNGRDCLRETLEAVKRYARPSPADLVLFDDSFFAREPDRLNTLPWRVIRSPESLGFCRATQELWTLASEPGPDYVFWIEDDILLRRPVLIEAMADVLAVHPKIAQMGLMRQPVNDREIAAGGVFELYREHYKEQSGWLESTTNFSTGCFLARRQFMVDHPWPDYDDSCEGRFSIDLLHRGFKFGVWGSGEPWVKHVGIRSGWGY